MFSIVPDGSVRRRPSDLVRVVVAATVVALTAAGAGEFSSFEHDVYDVLTDVPSELDWLFRLGYWLLPAAVAGIVVGAVVSRRSRLGLSVGAAAALTLAVGLALDGAVGAQTVDTLSRAGADLSQGAPDYPPIALAVSAAAVLAGAPYLTRPTRRIVRALVVVAAISAVVLVEGLPAGVLGGLALAWGIAAAVQFALGTPAGTPSPSEVTNALRDLGIEVATLDLAPDQEWGETRYIARTPDGREFAVAVLGRDAIDASIYVKIARFIWYKDSGPTLNLSRAQEVEHRAYLLLLTERAGGHVPELIAAGTAGDLGHALLITEPPTGRPFARLHGDDLTDQVLDDAWHNLDHLHAARISHGNMSLENVVLLPDGATALLDLSRTSSSASPERMALDSAELLAGTSALVGVPRALDAALRTIGTDGVEAALPLLQPSALSREVRHDLPKPKELLGTIRSEAAERIGVAEPELTELRRVSPTSLAMAAGAMFGVYLLLGELADVRGVGDVFTDPNWGWLVICFAVSQTPQFAGAVAMRGSVAAPLPLGPVTAVQFANNFTGLVGGTVATTALVVRFFQKQGLAVAVAVSSGVLNTIAAMIAQAVLLTVGLLTHAGDFDFGNTGGDSGSASTVIVIIVVVAGLSGAILLVPRLRRTLSAKLRPQFVAARDNLRELWGNPRKALQLFGGNVASQLLFAITLNAALHVYGTSLPIMELVVINSFASLLGGIAPVPGGMGVIEAGLIGGFTAAGVPETTAIAATFTARSFTAYLPPIWGWFSMQWLRHHDYL
jgi:uncharacterized membrane protein YbhN (UPF0104 family)